MFLVVAHHDLEPTNYLINTYYNVWYKRRKKIYVKSEIHGETFCC